MKTKIEKVAYPVRLPVDLKERLTAIAVKENRTLPAQMIRFLTEAVERYESGT